MIFHVVEADEDVDVGCMDAWCGWIWVFARNPALLPSAVEEVVEMCVVANEDARVDGFLSVSEIDGQGIPVRALQMSATGGAASAKGTVNRGLSQRLCVLGSSYRKIRFWKKSGG